MSEYQEFMGVRYYLCGKYYQNKGRRMHRDVWEFHNGKIPVGYHVHHKNENRGDNRIENLELLHRSSHASFHSSSDEAVARSRKNMLEVVHVAAKEWHGSEAGAT